jgi:hypothetical protein
MWVMVAATAARVVVSAVDPSVTAVEVALVDTQATAVELDLFVKL